MNAEAMLLVDNSEREVAKGNVILKKRVRADNDIDIA